MNHNPVVWFEIYVDDMARAKKFYEKIFDYKLEQLPNPGHEMWAFPGKAEFGGSTGMLIKAEGCHTKRGQSPMIYFGCEDCGEITSLIPGAGGEVTMKKTSIGQYGFIAMFVDTEGNTLGLHSMK